jgi:beta-galactosidase
MGHWTRRDLLRSGVAASASAAGQTRASGGTTAAGDAAVPPSSKENSERERLLLDFGWRFHLGHAWDQAKDFDFGGNARSAQTFAKAGNFLPVCNAAFDDGAWEKVDLPHDWAVGLPFVDAPPLVAHGSKPLGRAYPETSIGWYRRVFDIPAGDLGRHLSLEFDGVFRNALVVFNGHYMGESMSGYAPFHYDVTDYVNYGSRNVLVVRADATLNEGWFYEGAGIYRHVWLTKTSLVHVAQCGTFVRSQTRPGAAAVLITTEIDNDTGAERPCQVESTIVDAQGNAVARARSLPAPVPAGGRRAVEQRVTVANPALWSVDAPNLYRLQTVVETDGHAVDRYETPFGIRSFRFDPDQGFFLNDQPLKVKGTCNHQDHGGVGAAMPDRLQYFRLEKLKEMGSNGVRASHNPPTPELLDACDRIGMLVVDETRMMAATPEGFSQLERLIRRDRNHPSVFLWCLGNEEVEQATERGARIVATMRRLAKRLDPTRPVTVAQNRDFGKGVSLSVDVQGCNYREEQIDGFHKNFPKQPMIGTETGSIVSTRGAYETDRGKGYVGAFDSKIYRWPGAAQDWWKVYAERTFLSGAFAWTGFDYRGEPTPYGWPCISSHFGLLDMCGFPKDNFYYHQAWWSGKPVLYVLPHWNWPGREGQQIEIWVHSNQERVELFLNGQSQGAQNVTPDTRLVWKVKYAPGTLEARGFKGGKQVLAFQRETTGPAAKVALKPDRGQIDANSEDLSMVAVEIQDRQGRVVPVANNEVVFKVSGAGRLIGVCNGNPSSHEPDKADRRTAFNGLCMAIVQAGRQAGEIRVEATSPGLEGASAAIACQTATPRPAVA